MERDALVKDLLAEHKALLNDRTDWVNDWSDLSTQFMSRRPRFLDLDDKQNRDVGRLRQDLLDGQGVLSLRTLAAGMHGGMTSPARPWFALTLQDQDRANYRPVREWLGEATRRMRTKFARSNFYQAVHYGYKQLGCFGTFFMFEHSVPTPSSPIPVLRFSPLSIGEYCLALGPDQRVDSVYRLINMTARQIVMEYGKENCPSYVNQMANKPNGKFERFQVLHVVKPRFDREYGKMDVKNKQFASYHIVSPDKGGGKAHLLREGGYDFFPGFGPRWDVEGNDTYGQSPAMDALGDCKQLQTMRYTLTKARHKELDPPIAVPDSLKHPDLLPGGINVVESLGGAQQAVYPIYQVKPDSQGTMIDIDDKRRQIRSMLYNDLFLMIAQSGPNITATEVLERKEEKLLMLGPVLERLHGEMFDPIIDVTFQMMLDNGEFPEPPEELFDQDIKVDFVSVLAQAQKAVATSSKQALVQFVAGVAGVDPDAVDTINSDKIIDNYADALGIPADELNSEDVRVTKRQARQTMQAQQMGLASAVQGAQAAKAAADTPLRDGETNMLDATIAASGGQQ